MKVLATIKKEFLLLWRDLGGMALIFLMPLALVFVMALIQDTTFREFQETKLDVLFVDEDHGPLADTIRRAFQASGSIRIAAPQENRAVTESQAQVLVRNGSYKVAILVPAHASRHLHKQSQRAMTKILAHYGLANGPGIRNKEAAAITIRVLFDPAIKANYRLALTSAVEKIIAGAQNKYLMDELQTQFGRATQRPKMTLDLPQFVQVKKEDAGAQSGPGTALNSVQHNVPAWSMFATFFILFPLAGNFIREREEGSMMRLRFIAGSQFPVIAGKFIFYLCVCLLQLILMIVAGLYLMPLAGLDRLIMGTNYTGIVLTGLSVAMAATGYGLLIAVYFKTPQQALSFGSISVVILAAVGGVWVPVYVMPHAMQVISPYSPLHWGLSAFNNLFLRDASTSVILPDVGKLVGFSLATLAASIWIHKSRTVS